MKSQWKLGKSKALSPALLRRGKTHGFIISESNDFRHSPCSFPIYASLHIELCTIVAVLVLFQYRLFPKEFVRHSPATFTHDHSCHSFPPLNRSTENDVTGSTAELLETSEQLNCCTGQGITGSLARSLIRTPGGASRKQGPPLR